jgi:hypothetical protein
MPSPSPDPVRAGGRLTVARKLFDQADPFWNEPRVFSRWEAWVDLIQLAAYRPHSRTVGGRRVELARGQVLASVRFLAERWRWSKSKVQRWTEELRTMQRVEIQERDTQTTVYVLLNYDTYQNAVPDGGTPTGDRGTPQAKKRDTLRDTSRDTFEQLYLSDPMHVTDVPPPDVGHLAGHFVGHLAPENGTKRSKGYIEVKEKTPLLVPPPDDPPAAVAASQKPGAKGAKVRKPKPTWTPPPHKIPEEVDTPEVRAGWDERFRERGDPKVPNRDRPSEAQLASQLSTFAKLAAARGIPHALACLKRSTDAGYRGVIFPDDFEARNGNGRRGDPELDVDGVPKRPFSPAIRDPIPYRGTRVVSPGPVGQR